MKNLQDAAEKICELNGNLVARTVLPNAPVPDFTVAAFERDVARMASFIGPAAPVRP